MCLIYYFTDYVLQHVTFTCFVCEPLLEHIQEVFSIHPGSLPFRPPHASKYWKVLKFSELWIRKMKFWWHVVMFWFKTLVLLTSKSNRSPDTRWVRSSSHGFHGEYPVLLVICLFFLLKVETNNSSALAPRKCEEKKIVKERRFSVVAKELYCDRLNSNQNGNFSSH